MSYFQQAIKIYTNQLNYDSADREAAVNYDPENEPSMTGESYKNSDDSSFGTTGALFDLVDNKLNSVATFETNSQTTTATIDFDLTNNITFDATIIGNHNFKTADAKITVKDGGIAVAVTNSRSGTQQPDGQWKLSNIDSVSTNVVTVASDGCMIITHASTTSKNIQVTTDDVSTYDADITIGEVCLCNTWTAPHAPDIETWQDISNAANNVMNTQGGQNYSVGFHGERREWNMVWTGVSTSVKEELEQVYRGTKGARNPFWVDLGEYTSDRHYLHYVRFVDNQLVSTPLAGGTLWVVTLRFRQE